MSTIQTFFCISLLTPIYAFGDTPDRLVLSVGQSASLSLPTSAPLRVSSSQVLRVLPTAGSTQIIGRKAGEAIVSHAKGAVRVSVLSPSQWQLYQGFDQLLKNMKGLRLDAQKDEVLILGELLRVQDWQALASAQAAVNQSHYAFRARIHPLAAPETQSYLRDHFRKWGILSPELSLTPTPHLKLNSSQLARVQGALSGLGLEVHVDPGALVPDPLIRLHLTFAQVQQGGQAALGLRWQDGQAAQVLPQLNGPKELSARLAWLKSQGRAQVWTSPQLLTRSGSSAEFHSGGEIPIRSGSQRHAQVNWKRHGLSLKIKPQAQRKEFIRLEIETELSSPSGSHYADGNPGLNTARLTTQVDLAPLHSVALATLDQQWRTLLQSGPSGLMDLPLFGPLLQARDRTEGSSQLLVFITPEILDHQTDESQLQPKALHDSNDFAP